MPRRLARSPARPEIGLAVEALDVAAAAMRRTMALAGRPPKEIEAASKRSARLIAKLLRGAPVGAVDAERVVGALQVAAAVHRAIGGLGGARAARYERVARALAGDDAPHAEWAIGTRVVEIATGEVFWVDELHPTRVDLVGVIPDEGAPTVRWASKAQFAPAGRGHP